MPTSLAVFWGEDIQRRVGDEARKAGLSNEDYIGARASAEQLLQSLAAASDRLQSRFRKLENAVGRYQPIPASDRRYRAAVRRRGREHSSRIYLRGMGFARFIRRAALSGDEEVVRHQRQQLRCRGRVRRSVRALAVTAGGESGNPMSPHFNDEAKRYSTGDLREVYFYPAQLTKHTERKYHPGS